jgi:prephenate dehydratase
MKKIAFQGTDGAYSEQAALAFFGRKISTCGFEHFEDVFKGVVSGRAQCGVVPIENSLAGSIHQNYDLLLKYHVWICGEIKLRIQHHLIVNPGVSARDLRRVYSIAPALDQCQEFLSRLKGVEQVPYSNTAAAVKMIRDKHLMDSGAIASKAAAQKYRMKILHSAIEDNEKNYTRFVVLTKKVIKPSGKCKTSLVFALKNVPGALWKSLSVFAIQDLDLYKIESRPIPGSPWQYIFYLDLGGDIFNKSIKRAVDHLSEITTYLKVLGSFPLGKEVVP